MARHGPHSTGYGQSPVSPVQSPYQQTTRPVPHYSPAGASSQSPAMYQNRPLTPGTGGTSTGVLGGVAGPPVDPTLVAQQNAANLSIGLGNAWDTYQQGQIGLGYGNLDNPAGDLTSNPYSKAALYLKLYQNQQRGNLTSFAARGDLYSGAYQGQTEADLQGYNRGVDALKKERQGALDALVKGELDRYSQVGASLSTDELASIMRALGAA